VGAAIPAHAQQKLVPLRFDVRVENYSLPYLVAYEAGIFKKNGIDLQPFIGEDKVRQNKRSGILISPERVGAVGKEAMISLGGLTPRILQAATEPRPLKTVAIASNCDHTDWVLISRKDITKPEQLKGKRIGYHTIGVISHTMALIFAKKMGWDPVQDVSLISDAWQIGTLRDGLVDAAFMLPTVAIMAKAEGFNVLVDMRQKPWREPLASNALHVDRAWLQNNRETARRFVKSLVEGIALTKKDKQATYRAMAKWFNFTDPQKQAQLYAYVADLNPKPFPAVEDIKKTMEVYDSLEMRKHKPEDFYDDSFVRELDQSGFIDSLYK
jgi:NitT/TauT family transport system substrate-binding protein